jgi:hypothetical protein
MLFKFVGFGSEDSSNPPHAYHEWSVAHFRILWSEIDLLLSMYCASVCYEHILVVDWLLAPLLL